VASINSVVTIQISANSRTAAVPGFGVPLIMLFHTVFPEMYRIYSDTLSMITDGFSSNSAAVLMATALFDQDPTVTSVVVGRMNTCPAFTQVLTVGTSTQGAHVRAKVIDSAGVVQQLDYAVGASETLTTVATAFELLVEAVTGVASTSSVAAITVTPVSANGYKPYFYDLENCGIHETTADSDYDDALTALAAVFNGWYFITTDTESPANVAKIAAYALTNKKIYFVNTQSDLELDGTGTLGFDLKTLSNDRTVILYHANPAEFAAVRWVAVGASKTPGSITWANKTLKGATFDVLTGTQESNLHTDNENDYQEIATLGHTGPAVVTSGEWIDVRHGVDALSADMQAAVWTVLANSDKVPFTDAGLDLIASAMLASLKRFEGDRNSPGLLVPGSSKVLMPTADSISTTDKKLRRLRNVRFSAKFSSAVHAVDLVGTLEY
jgi:hypothetical protein